MPVFGDYTTPPGNTDFTPGSVIQSSENDSNFDQLATHLNSQFVDDDIIADEAIDGAKLTIGTLDGDRLIPGSILAGSFAAGSIVNADIADDAIEDRNISEKPTNGGPAGGGVDGNKVIDGSLPLSALGFSIPSGPGNLAVGFVGWFAGMTAPPEYVVCDGAEYDQGTYALLYGQIGNIYDNHPQLGLPAPGNFRVPDILSRMIVGTGTNNTLADTDALAEASRNSPEHSHVLSGEIDPAPNHDHSSGSLIANVSGTTGDANNEGAANSHHEGFILNSSGASKISGNHGIGPSDFAPSGGGSGDNFTKLSHAHNFNDAASVTGNTGLGGSHTHTDTYSIDNAEMPYIALLPCIYTGV